MNIFATATKSPAMMQQKFDA